MKVKKQERSKLLAHKAVWTVFLISILFGISQTNLELSKWKRKDKIWINTEIISAFYKKPGELQLVTSNGLQVYLPLVKNVDACQKGNKIKARVKVYPNRFIKSFSKSNSAFLW